MPGGALDQPQGLTGIVLRMRSYAQAKAICERPGLTGEEAQQIKPWVTRLYGRVQERRQAWEPDHPPAPDEA